jgi:RNA polymerase sigma factor (sigma-70 family)
MARAIENVNYKSLSLRFYYHQFEWLDRPGFPYVRFCHPIGGNALGSGRKLTSQSPGYNPVSRHPSPSFPFRFDFMSGLAYEGSLKGTTQMETDSDLLRSFVGDGRGEAFTQVVRRNVDLVHSCILRRVGGDSQIAEDLTQKVFSDLARKAATLANLSSVSGWLYVSANLASAEYVRNERRRKTRELEASRMQEIMADERTPAGDEWDQVRNLIDDLICELSSSDREAVVLRFFSRRTYLEIAAVQCATEEAARKRVMRALEKLRLRLARSGITSSVEALEAALLKQQATNAPQKLADRVAGIAVVEFGAVGATTSWLLSMARILTSKAGTMGAVFVAAAILVAWQHHRNDVLRGQIWRLRVQDDEIHGLEQDNGRLAQAIVEANGLQGTLATIPSPGAPRGISADGKVSSRININVTAEGTIRWENDPVTLGQFLNRLVASHSQGAASGPQVIINGAPGATFSQTAYVVEQASKAGFHDILINSQASLTPGDAWAMTAPLPLKPGEVAPPTLPDEAVRP